MSNSLEERLETVVAKGRSLGYDGGIRVGYRPVANRGVRGSSNRAWTCDLASVGAEGDTLEAAVGAVESMLDAERERRVRLLKADLEKLEAK